MKCFVLVIGFKFDIFYLSTTTLKINRLKRERKKNHGQNANQIKIQVHIPFLFYNFKDNKKYYARILFVLKNY